MRATKDAISKLLKRERRARARLALLLAALLVPLPACLGWNHFKARRLSHNERSANRSVREIYVALAKAKEHPAWSGGVAELRDFVPPGRSSPIALISPELAAAEPARKGARPYNGYWFILLGPRGRELVGAYPAEYGVSGRWTYIIHPDHSALKGDTRGLPLTRVPEEEELKQHWAKFQ